MLFLQSKDPNTGRTYYYHTGTRETRWTKPEEMDEGGLKTAKADSEGQGNFLCFSFCFFVAFSTPQSFIQQPSSVHVTRL